MRDDPIWHQHKIDGKKNLERKLWNRENPYSTTSFEEAMKGNKDGIPYGIKKKLMKVNIFSK
jgi:hypothetical protein